MTHKRRVLKLALDIARRKLAGAQKGNSHANKGALKYRAKYGHYPADNFNLLDISTDVKLYKLEVKYLENQLKIN